MYSIIEFSDSTQSSSKQLKFFYLTGAAARSTWSRTITRSSSGNVSSTSYREIFLALDDLES
jgi:hypothetical protein